MAEELVGTATKAFDSAEVHLHDGELTIALRTMERARRAIHDENGIVHGDERVTHSVIQLQGKLSEVATIVNGATDSIAIAQYNKAAKAIDSVRIYLQEGKVQVAHRWLMRARGRFEQALYIIKAPNRAMQAIEVLRGYGTDLLSRLSIDSYRERGIIVRALQLADSAEALLANGVVQQALHLAQHTWRKLLELMPYYRLQQPALADSIVVRVRQLIKQAMTLVTPEADQIVTDLIHEAGLLAEEGTDSGTAENSSARAYRLVTEALGILNGTTVPNGTDEVMQDLIDAGEKATSHAERTGVHGTQPEHMSLGVSVTPNPFNPSTTIRFVLPSAGSIRLSVYDVLGCEIALLSNQYMASGAHEVHWNAGDKNGRYVASGVYVVLAETIETQIIRRITLSK